MKNALFKTTTAPFKDNNSEIPAPIRVFPDNVRTTSIIKINNGDINSEQKYVANHLNANSEANMNRPYETIKQYKVIDPTTNKVSNKTAKDFLGNNSTLSLKTLDQIISSGHPTVENFNINSIYQRWYYEGHYKNYFSDYTEGDTKEFDGNNAKLVLNTGSPDYIYNGVALAYNHTPSGTEVTEETNSQYLVPHLRLFIKVKTKYIPDDVSSDPDQDCLAYWNPLFRDSLGMETGSDIGIITGKSYQSTIVPGTYPSAIPQTTNTVSSGEWIGQSIAGVIVFYAADNEIANKYVRLNTISGYSQDDNSPYLSFIKYTGESGLGTSSSNSSGTTIDSGTSEPSSASLGDLFINTSTNLLKRWNGTAWENIGGSSSGTTIDSGTSEPSSASLGDLFINTSTNLLKRWNGTAWENIGGSSSGTTIDSGTSEPSSPSLGDLFINTSTNLLKGGMVQHGKI